MDKYKIMKIISRLLFAVIVVLTSILLLVKFDIISFNSSDLPLVMSLNQSEIGIKLGDTYQLEPTILPDNVYYGKIVWTSSNEKVARVNENTGFVTTYKIGEAVITAKIPFNNLEAKCIIHVLDKDVLVKSLYITSDKINLAIGRNYKLRYKVSPSNATTHSFNFYSSDNKIAVINEEGVIKAIGEGTAIITVKSKYNTVKDSVLIRVYRYSNSINKNPNEGSSNNGTYTDVITYYKTKSVSLSKTKVSLNRGAQYKLTATVLPSNANQLVNWSSHNENIATVNSDGVVIAKAVGSTKIVATSIDGVVALCDVIVNDEDVNEKVGIDIKERTLKIKIGDTKKVNVNFYLIDSNKQGIIWSSSNNDIAFVDNGIITAKSVGTCIIKASSIDAKYNDYVTVTVLPTDNVISLKVISFDKVKYEASVNDTITLVPRISPSNATNRFLVWTTSNRNVATVKNGVVYCMNEGTAKIIASNGDIDASVIINVTNVNPSNILIENASNPLKLNIGEGLYLIKKIIPNNATNNDVIWKSDRENVVTVDNNGYIFARQKGSALITVKTVNGKTASVNVIVS